MQAAVSAAAIRPLLIGFPFLSSQGTPPTNSSSPGDRRVWVAAWQGCVHGNQSV